MAGVNDLVNKWRNYDYVENIQGEWRAGSPYDRARDESANELEHVSRAAWHPISDPPKKEDADEDGYVLLWLGDGCISITNYRSIASQDVMVEKSDRWARICDVVLMPPPEE